MALCSVPGSAFGGFSAVNLFIPVVLIQFQPAFHRVAGP